MRAGLISKWQSTFPDALYPISSGGFYDANHFIEN